VVFGYGIALKVLQAQQKHQKLQLQGFRLGRAWFWLWLIPISLSIFLGGNFVMEFAVRMLLLGVIDSRALFEINLVS